MLHVSDKSDCFHSFVSHLLEKFVDGLLVFHKQNIRSERLAVDPGRSIDHQVGNSQCGEHAAVFIMKQLDAEDTCKTGKIQIYGQVQRIQVVRQETVDGHIVAVGRENLLHPIQRRHGEMGISGPGGGDQGDLLFVGERGLDGSSSGHQFMRVSGRIDSGNRDTGKTCVGKLAVTHFHSLADNEFPGALRYDAGIIDRLGNGISG